MLYDQQYDQERAWGMTILRREMFEVVDASEEVEENEETKQWMHSNSC